MLKQLAYIDAGTGSIVLQAVLGAVLGVTYMLRNQFRIIMAKIKREPKTEDSSKN